MINAIHATPYPDVNAVLSTLLAGVEAILDSHLIGMYLEGSLANGDFDQSSDIDFVVVSDEAISDELFLALRALHDRIATSDSPWVIQLEGSYLSQQALRRYDPAHALHPNLERGVGERLKLVQHDESWVTHRYILREHGITLTGPTPQTLIDPVAPNDLRLGMSVILQGWATQILGNPAQMESPGYQAYTVLSLCRILYTLHYGTVVSKCVAAQWALATLGKQWVALIEQAWQTRQSGQWPAQADTRQETLAFIRYVLEQRQQFEKP